MKILVVEDNGKLVQFDKKLSQIAQNISIPQEAKDGQTAIFNQMKEIIANKLDSLRKLSSFV